MNYLTTVRESSPPFPLGLRKPRLLIVSDSEDRLRGLRASLDTDENEIISARSVEEVRRACRGGLDLAVVDVGPAALIEVLRTLRAQAGCSGISILVEANRLPAEPRLTGVLPKYRAMPCSHSDLILLARRQTAPDAGRREAKKIL